MSCHTPAPWRAVRSTNDAGLDGYVISAGKMVIAEIWPKPYPVAVSERNADLIAAAPHLYWICSMMLKMLDGSSPRPTQQTFADLEAVIRKTFKAIEEGGEI